MIVQHLRELAPSEIPTLIQVLSCRPAGGFPSPAADHYEPPISLDKLVELRAPHVWLGETEGDSMSPAGILHRTKLVIDRSRDAVPGRVVVAYVDNQPVVKRLTRMPGGKMQLTSDNPAYPAYPAINTDFDQIEVFGVVTWSFTCHVD